jgi:hypothetical protein
MTTVCTEILYEKIGFRPNFQIQIPIPVVSRFFCVNVGMGTEPAAAPCTLASMHMLS